MPIAEIMAYLRKHREDAFCTIARPDGKGHLQCGSLAWKKFGEVADQVLALDTELKKRVDRERVKSVVIEVFAQLILKEHLDVNHQTAEQLLERILETLRQSLVVSEHYLPCILFLHGGPDQFNVGPITFTRRAKFFKDKKQVFKRSVEEETAAHIEHVNKAVNQGFPRERAATASESRKLIRGLQARAIRTCRSYPWIASVQVTNCDANISTERAARAVEMALHVIRVILGANRTKKLRLAWSRSDALRTAHMWANARGVIQVSIGSSSIGPVGFTNWHEALCQCSNELGIFGSALSPLVNPLGIFHLHERFLDAINWFGDAATDSTPTASIVKYVSAIERLLFGKFVQGHGKAFANRVKSIYEVFDCEDGDKAYETALKVYDTRSALLHGAYSPRDEKAQHVVHDAEELSRMCLLCSAQLYPMMLHAFDNPDPAKLEDVMVRVGKEGLDWLVEAARPKTSNSVSPPR